jgi:uncharacterized protein YdeI (YjbR/CyaY-like superfamily)
MNPKVDFFFNKAKAWKEEYELLRKIALGSELVEELKWGCPCYTFGDKNVVLIHGFKDYCALLFMKGAIMKDPASVLIQQTENVQSARQMRFTSLDQIKEMKPVIESYIYEAATIEEAGLKVDLKKTTQYSVPDEFQRKLDENAVLRTAFQSLTPGRQRAYLLHFSSPKQSKTRESRIDKCTGQILEGKGLND